MIFFSILAKIVSQKVGAAAEFIVKQDKKLLKARNEFGSNFTRDSRKHTCLTKTRYFSIPEDQIIKNGTLILHV